MVYIHTDSCTAAVLVYSLPQLSHTAVVVVHTRGYPQGPSRGAAAADENDVVVNMLMMYVPTGTVGLAPPQAYRGTVGGGQ